MFAFGTKKQFFRCFSVPHINASITKWEKHFRSKLERQNDVVVEQDILSCQNNVPSERYTLQQSEVRSRRSRLDRILDWASIHPVKVASPSFQQRLALRKIHPDDQPDNHNLSWRNDTANKKLCNESFGFRYCCAKMNWSFRFFPPKKTSLAFRGVKLKLFFQHFQVTLMFVQLNITFFRYLWKLAFPNGFSVFDKKKLNRLMP